MKKAILSLLVYLFALSIQAQSDNDNLLKKLVEKNLITQEDADQLKTENKPDAKQSLSLVDKIRTGFNTPYLNFSGYGQLVYQYTQYPTLDGAHHNFVPRLVLVNMAGKVTKTIDYSFLYDFAHSVLYEYFVDWTPKKYFNVRAGQFKVPFTLENPISLTALETVYNTRSVAALTGMSGDVQNQYAGINSTGRDLGIQASGELITLDKKNYLEYEAGLFQGAGINTPENNSSKDFAGTLIAKPITGLKVAAGIYAGQTLFKNPGEVVFHDHVRNRWALSAEYKADRFYGRSEWIHGDDGGVKKEGLYGTVLYYVMPKKLNLMTKVDYYNKDKALNQEVVDYTAGINLYFAKQCRFQVIYTYSNYSKNYGQRDASAIQSQFQIIF